MTHFQGQARAGSLSPSIAGSSDDDVRYLTDQVVEQSVTSDSRKTSLFTKFAKDILRVLPHGSDIYREEGVAGLVSDKISPGDRRLVSWVLLRYLGSHGSFPAKPAHLRPKFIAFIERELGNELKKVYSIDFSRQSHDVESKLSSIVPQIEKIFFETTQFCGLAVFKDFTRQVLNSLNSRTNAGLLFTFMERQAVNNAIKNAFSAIEAFSEAKGVQALDEYYTSIEACDSCLEVLLRIPTKYAKHLGQLIRSAKDAVGAQMKDLRLTDPARLVMNLEPKKYPLHLVGTDLVIRIRVSNNGTGKAFNCHLTVEGIKQAIHCITNLPVGNLQANESRVVYANATVIASRESAFLHVTASWTNFDNSVDSSTTELEILSQDPNIDWEALESKQPYALEVAIGEDFVGRDRLLKRLSSTFSRSNPGSIYLWGQKRVGKTSVAKALTARLVDNKQICVAYLETIRDVTAEDTINRMCLRLIEQMRITPALASIPIRDPMGTLAPLSEFLEQATIIEPMHKFIIILDEFDELPVELYKARGTADAFFQTLGKGLAGKQNIGGATRRW